MERENSQEERKIGRGRLEGSEETRRGEEEKVRGPSLLLFSSSCAL
jgi:hypothetical protein